MDEEAYTSRELCFSTLRLPRVLCSVLLLSARAFRPNYLQRVHVPLQQVFTPIQTRDSDYAEYNFPRIRSSRLPTPYIGSWGTQLIRAKGSISH